MTNAMNPNKPILFLTGQNGMLGQQLTQNFAEHYQVVGLKRNNQAPNEPTWCYQQALDELNIAAPDVVVHLAGAGIADKRWNEKYKDIIYNSRVNGTQWLVNEIIEQKAKPHTFISASAIGYYGNRPNETLDEDSSNGDNFVAKIAVDWEQASQSLESVGTRIINLRFGMILSASGGALKDMILPFKLGLGGRLGSGQQQYSWISITDAIRAIDYLIKQTNCHGPFNLTSPNSVSNKEFTRTLANSLNRPAFMHMPAFMVGLIFGEMADELLLADADVSPKKLISAGFKFNQAQLAEALQEILQ